MAREQRMLSKPQFRDGVRPIFIVGAPRSGTSILTWALGQHPNIQPMPETSWIAALATGALLAYEIGSARGRYSHLSNVGFPFDPFVRRMGEAVDAVVHDVYEERCRRLYGDYRESGLEPLQEAAPSPHLQLRRRAQDPKARWVDGTPLNSHYIWPLALMFPEARFLHSLRRPEEVVTSLEAFDAVGGERQVFAEGIATWMRHTESAWLGEQALGRSRVRRVDYQMLQDDPERLCSEVLEFLGEEPHPDCVEAFADRINSSRAGDERRLAVPRLRARKAFAAARDLYETVMASPPVDPPDEEAHAVLRQRFLARAAEQCIR
jgi:hypothetical protein